MRKEMFDIEKFNVISDEENYYFFRSLEPGDIEDLEKGIIKDGESYKKLRTDRERWEETHQEEPRWNAESKVTLEEMYNHIKMHYSLQTNCISLSSNANVARTYGEAFSDKYVMIKVPKKEMGEKVFNAGQYMLDEIAKQVEQIIAEGKIPTRVLNDLQKIDAAKTSDEIKELIKIKYKTPQKLDKNKARPKRGITYKSPHARISSWQSLNEEQTLEKNKVIAKLTVLEHKKLMKPLITHSANNNLLIQTVGSAFASSEQIYYGDIEGDRVTDISKEIVDMFGLLQQVEGQDKEIVDELKGEVIRFVNDGKKIEIPENSILRNDTQARDDISIEEMYELTDGKVEYGETSSIVKNLFYLAKGQASARALAKELREITNNNPKYEQVIKYIEENGFEIEPKIITRQSNKGYKLSESVNLNLAKDEQILVDEIKKLSANELDEVLQNGGLSNVQNVISKVYGKQNEQIDKSRYYADAIISQYDWSQIGIEEFKISERNELIKRLQDKNCVDIYENLRQSGVDTKQIPTILLNIATRQGFYEEYEKGNLEQLLNTRQDVLQNSINIELVERFLGYYDVENTEIRLKDYQQRAYDNVNKIFEDHKFAQVILPTGAGKSFVALAQMQKYAEEHPGEKMLYLAPQDEILNQIKNYIIKYVHGKQNTVGKTEDEIIAEIFPNISFETYSGLLAKRGQEVIKEQYGMIVLDELHRTGAKEWEGKIDGLLDNQNEDVKVLGITATPVRDADGRDMAEETAKKLGYTDEEVKQRKHLASNMTLENAIRMGYVVNPKLVYCKYDLISSGKMDELRAKIDDIEDESKRAEELQKYNELRQKLNREIDDEIGEDARKQLEEEARKNLDNGIGKEEILRQNVKKGGKYIVFIPVTDQGEIEDEDGNRIGTKTGEDKIQAYQEYLNKVFDGTDIVPQLHSLLGSYSKDKNKEELEAFESDNSEETKFMVVMNKANEGLHIDGVDGIVWFRALDENSRILYLQQLGRAIYALDEDNPLPDDKRPVVIDLANNSLAVKIEKEFEYSEPIDDLEALTIIIDWINVHNGMLPNRESSNKQEQHYYALLRKIQSKYSKYLDGFDNFEDLTDEDKSRIQEIIDLASEIELWDMELPPIPKTRGSKKEFDPFTVEGILKDYIEVKDEIELSLRGTIFKNIAKIENWCKLNYGNNEVWNRKLPSRKSNSEEEKKLARTLEHIRIRMQQYKETELDKIENKDDREAVERVRKLDKEYGLSISLKNALEIENWCKLNYGDKEIWNRKLPSQISENIEEKRLGQALSSIRQNKMKKYEKVELEKIENEEDRKVIEIVRRLDREYGLSTSLKNALEIENWCKLNYGDKEVWNRKLPSKTSKDEEEKYLGNALKTIKSKMKKYEGIKLEKIENEEDRKVIEIVRRLDREYGLSTSLKSALEIENWCQLNYGDKEVWNRKLPSTISKDEEEKYIGNALKTIKRKMKKYEGIELEKIENEEDRKVIEIVRRLDREYGLSTSLKSVLEIENWCKLNYGNNEIWDRKLPSITSNIEKEQKLGKSLSRIRQKIKKYQGIKLEKIEEKEDRKVVEIIRRLDDEYGLSVSLKNALKIEDWCKLNYGDKEIWDRRLPNDISKDEEEKRLGEAFRSIKKQIKKYQGIELEKIECEEDRKIVKIVRKLDKEYGLSSSLKNALEIENWCKIKFDKEKIYDRRLPSQHSKNEEERKLGQALNALRRKMKKYQGQEIADIQNEEDRKIFKIIDRLDREYNSKKIKLNSAKNSRDSAKIKNDQAKELERQVSEQLKKRGQAHEEQ